MTDDKTPRLELSLTQIIASALAAMTAAVLASYLGVAGTVIGAAVFSIMGTAGSAIYSHSIRRTKARLRRTLIVPVNPGGAPAHAPTGVAAQETGVFDRAAGAAAAARAAWAAAAAHAESPNGMAAEREPGEGEPGNGEPREGQAKADEPRDARPQPTAPADADEADAAESGRPAGEETVETTEPVIEENRVVGEPTAVGAPADARSAVVEETEQSTRRPLHWKPIAIAAAAVFVVAMAGITVVEAIAGQSVPALVHGQKHGSRFWFEPGSHTGSTPTPTPSGTASPTATPTSTATSTPSAPPSQSQPVVPPPGQPSSTPSVSSSPTPTPTPSVLGSPSPSPTPVPSTSASPSPTGQPPAAQQQGAGAGRAGGG